ncbi:PH domain-containing protein [Halanaeroarchaeum sulfurireducens]|uniref:PH domain-containing protein n=1 Tax=Halanaeroarchaeum sulfurireducens TaxID=1604004 RepID=UPI0006787D12|nr:PH domain-containing protein [Halanaeroarchaeum sulfurireducens]
MRLHPLTVALEGIGRAFGAGVIGFTFGSIAATFIVGYTTLPAIGSAAGVPLAMLFGVIAFVYEIAHYRHFEYELAQDSLDIASGVFFRRDREIPLERIQNVDISRTVPARILGLAVVTIETAGGGETEARLRYVGLAEARRLQEGIRRRKRTAIEEAGAEPERDLLFALDDEDLVLLSVLSFDPRILSVVFVIAPVLGPNLVPDVSTPDRFAAVVLALIGALVTAVGIWGLSAAATFVQFYGFKLYRVGDELQYERGLIQRYDGSVPIEKIQTLVVEENVLMRRFGYAALRVDTAGYAPGSTPSGGSEAAIPLAATANIYQFARQIADFERPEMRRLPKRARRRYVARYSLAVGAVAAVAGVVGTQIVSFPWYWTIVLFAFVPVAADRTWRHRGWALGDGFAFTRSGFWRRRTHVVPDFRVQTVIERQSPFQRRWSLASVALDTASSGSLLGGGAVAIDLDADDARGVREAVRSRLQAALSERRRARGED